MGIDNKFGGFKVGNQIRARQARFSVPIVALIFVEGGENFSVEQNGGELSSDAEILTNSALVAPELKPVNVIESLRDSLSADMDRIFNRGVELELEKDLRRV